MDLRFQIGGSDKVTVDSAGRLLVKTSSSQSVYGLNHQLQVEGTTGATSSASFTRNSDDSNPPYLTLAKSRGGSIGSNTIIQDGDYIGVLSFNAADGTNRDHMVAQIHAHCDGTPGANDVPGRLAFYTTADGSNSSTQRMVIKSDGKIGVNISTPGTLFHQHESSSAANYHKFTNSTTGSAGTDGAYVGLDASERFIMWTQETGKIRFGVGNAERAYVNNDGHLGIVDGNLVIATNGHGIDFSASEGGTSTSSMASILADYEEGNWSPGAEGFTISSTISARYTKVGRLVTVNAYVNAATGSGSSAVQITNLPFNQYGNSNYHYGSGRIGSAGANTNSQNNIVFQIQQNTNKAKIYVNDGGINEAMISGQHIIFSATYEAS
tara:strand:- start:92 stop:1234 length:1143 start_codon:yes stop_codon:yes gene_type:complete